MNLTPFSDLLKFLQDNPVIAWFAFLALMLILVSVVSVIWDKRSGRRIADRPKQPEQATESTRFGIQSDLIVVLIGLILLLGLLSWVGSTFFG